MIGRGAHLDDDCLLEAYLADRWGEPSDAPAAQHLADCAACRTRYVEMARLLTLERDEANREADEALTAGHLRHQHDRILRRLEHLNRPARVISFPVAGAKPFHAAAGRLAPRWIAAAAAAGLFLGVTVGGLVGGRGTERLSAGLRMAGAQTITPRTLPVPALLVGQPAGHETFDDEVFLKELDFALERPRTRELLPFDALTPHVWDLAPYVRDVGNRVQ